MKYRRVQTNLFCIALCLFGLSLFCQGAIAGSLWDQMIWDQDVWSCGSPDSDGDTICDEFDNCTNVANTNQLDTDYDNIGNACDCDFNQDSFCGGPDFTIFVGCFNAPTNGIPNCEAADMNGDGFVGGPDFTRFISGFNGAPGPAAAP